MLASLIIAVFAFAGTSTILLLSSRSLPLYKGWSSSAAKSKVTLTSPDAMQIAAIFLSIFLKYIPGTTGNKTGLIVDSEGKGFDLQPVTLTGPIQIDSHDFDTFNIAISRQSYATNMKQLNPFFLVSFTTPLLLFILSNHSCPIRPLGAVNTRNRFTFEDANFCQDKDAILAASQSGTLSYTCTFGGTDLPGKRRKRGVECDIIIEVIKEEKTVFRQQFSFLQFLPSKHKPRFIESAQIESQTPTTDNKSDDEVSTQFDLQMNSSDPQRWAASCKDYNPIHISSLAAKAFGFRSTIAHGNYAVALAIQGLINSLKDKDSLHLLNRFELEVTFVKPMLLPARLKVSWQGSEKTKRLQIMAKDKVLVSGELQY